MSTEITECDSKQLFKLVKKLTVPATVATFPDHSSDTEMANEFGKFFYNKMMTPLLLFLHQLLLIIVLHARVNFQNLNLLPRHG